jgi:multidrug efflux system membrane fusion protein
VKSQRQTFLIIGCTAALILTLLAWRVIENARAARVHPEDQPLPVNTAYSEVQPMPVILQAVGQVQSEHTVQVKPQVNGILKEVDFQEGQYVEQGQKLFQIDPAPFEAALASAKAAAEDTKANADRLEPLAKQDYVTAQEYQDARSAADQAQATLQQAQINLSYTDIRAQVSGRTGSLAVRAGNVVAPTDATPLVVINQMKPILVQYIVPQQNLEEVREYQAKHPIKVVIKHENGDGELDEGDLVFIDNTVNTSTGTVMLKARLPNLREQLWPGQYVDVEMQLAVQKDAVTVPQNSVQTGQDGNFVYLVQSGSAVVRNVKVDRQIGDLAVISSGLKGGEQIITVVPRNLRPDMKVQALGAITTPAPTVQMPTPTQ